MNPPIYVVLAAFLLPVGMGLLLRFLSKRKPDYVNEYRQRLAALQERLQNLLQRAGDKPAPGVKVAANLAQHFLQLSSTALEFQNVARAQDHQKLVVAILGLAEALQDGDLSISDPVVELLLDVLDYFEDRQLAAAESTLNVRFEQEPGLVLRQLGLSCVVWLHRTRSQHDAADAAEHELQTLPGRMAEAGL